MKHFLLTKKASYGSFFYYVIAVNGSTATLFNIIIATSGGEISAGAIRTLKSGGTLKLAHISDNPTTLPSLSASGLGRQNARFLIYKVF